MSIWTWWAYDTFTIIASFMGEDVLAAQTIMRSLQAMTSIAIASFGFGTATLVGVSIGKA